MKTTPPIIDAFPKNLQEIIIHYAEVKGYPMEFIAISILTASSVALGRAVVLNSGNFSAIGIIWAMLVAKPGFVKSEALTDGMKPINNRQFEELKSHRMALDELEEYKAAYLADKKGLSKPPATIPTPPQFILRDTTSEVLLMTLANNPRGILLLNDELAGFIDRFNRYNSGADEQMYLSLFNGDTVMRTRVNSSVNAAVKDTFVSIFGTIQPSVLKKVFFDKSDSGFFDRWLICFIEDMKKEYPNPFGIDPAIEGKYSFIINRIMEIEFDELNPIEMIYTTESYKIVNDYQRQLIDQENETQNDIERAILAKMEIYLHRFALLFQVLQYANSDVSPDSSLLSTVSVQASEGAITLCKYFIEQAKKVRITKPNEQLKAPWSSIYKNLPDHGLEFKRGHFLKVCKTFGIESSTADLFLKDNAEHSEKKLFFKVKQGIYTKNLL